jgi:hypothetical protein
MKLNPQSRHAGPPLLLLAVVHVLLFAASVVAGSVLRHGAVYVNPYSSSEAVQNFFANSPRAIRVSTFFFFGSAVVLGLFTATVASRLRFLGVRAAGSYIALFGGFAASIVLATSALFSWVLSISDIVSSSAGLVHALYFVSFLFGGVAFAVGFGLLTAGVSITSYFRHLLPRWLVVFGMVIALAGEFSSLSLITYPASLLLPLTRFGGFVWLIAVAVLLPATRHNDATPKEATDGRLEQ